LKVVACDVRPDRVPGAERSGSVPGWSLRVDALLCLNGLTQCIILEAMETKRNTKKKRAAQSLEGRSRRRSSSAPGGARRMTMTPQTHDSAIKDSVSRDPLGDMRLKAIDALTACSEANQRVLGELVSFSSAAVKESVRVYGEIGAATFEAVRAMSMLP